MIMGRHVVIFCPTASLPTLYYLYLHVPTYLTFTSYTQPTASEDGKAALFGHLLSERFPYHHAHVLKSPTVSLKV